MNFTERIKAFLSNTEATERLIFNQRVTDGLPIIDSKTPNASHNLTTEELRLAQDTEYLLNVLTGNPNRPSELLDPPTLEADTHPQQL